ncbi:hypothetical protein [Bradyrhizobium sp. USDA 336]|uniref:hypothetical protein n=1 Tax=Bradyrhizobium sp. USDA 336 TaxID=3156311 RepID=UPI00384CE3D6
MAVERDSAGVRFPPPFVYLGALLLGLAAERFVTQRSFGIDWRLLVAAGAPLFVAGAAMMPPLPRVGPAVSQLSRRIAVLTRSNSSVSGKYPSVLQGRPNNWRHQWSTVKLSKKRSAGASIMSTTNVGMMLQKA